MDKKIMICGASGTGKTTLAKHISELYELPYISTSASKVWGKFGFKTHKEALSRSLSNPDLGLQYQMDVLVNRKKELKLEPKYVTDRSYIDNFVYLSMQTAHFLKQEDHEELLIKCMEGMKGVDGLIFLRWNFDIELEDNGRRIMNRIYHEMIDNMIRWVLTSSMAICPLLELTMWDFETRIELVDKWVKDL